MEYTQLSTYFYIIILTVQSVLVIPNVNSLLVICFYVILFHAISLAIITAPVAIVVIIVSTIIVTTATRAA